jgi:hypothetical protein
MDDLLTLSRPETRPRRRDVVPAVLVGLLLAGLLSFTALSLRTPDTVSLTVSNPLSWRAEVAVRPSDSSGWTGLGAVAREGELEFLQLPDQGRDWIVRYSYAGQSEEVAVSRDQLEADGWVVEVPASLGQRLRDAGVAQTTGSSAG